MTASRLWRIASYFYSDRVIVALGTSFAIASGLSAAFCESDWLSCLSQSSGVDVLNRLFIGNTLLFTTLYLPGVLMPLVIRRGRGLRLIPLVLLGCLAALSVVGAAQGGHDCDRKGCDLGLMIFFGAIAFNLASGALSCVLASCGTWWAKARSER